MNKSISAHAARFVPQEHPTRGVECPTRVSHNSVRQSCQCRTRVSRKSLPQERAPQECHIRMPHKSGHKSVTPRVFLECHAETALPESHPRCVTWQEFPKKCRLKNDLQECQPKRVSHESTKAALPKSVIPTLSHQSLTPAILIWGLGIWLRVLQLVPTANATLRVPSVYF